MANNEITLRDIYAARQRIAPYVRRTALVASPALSELAGVPVHLKLENSQQTGSFKPRGAANKIVSLSEEERQRGLVTVSTGNHGRAMAYVAAKLGVRAVVCTTSRAAANKLEAIRQLGAEVVIAGDSQDEAELRALQLSDGGLTFVHPFDDPFTIAGQGTIGVEILEDLPEVDTVVVPLSGGGLMAGIALAMKSANNAVHMVGVTMESGAAMYESMKTGEMVEVVEEDTLADALAGGLGSANHYTLRMCQQFVNETLLVSEDEIGEAMAFALKNERLVLEGGAAVGIAALLHKKVTLGESVVVVLSGGNVDMVTLMELAGKYSV